MSDDDELLARLGEALGEQDDVPPRLAEQGKALFALYSLESDLAALLAEENEAAGLRSGSRGARELEFTAGDLTIHVEVTARQVSGQVVPPQAGEVNVQTEAGPPRRADVDELGWFAVSPAPTERFRVLFLGAGGGRAATGWIPAR